MKLLENLFSTAQAWAASGAGEHEAPSINDIWFPLGNFLIFAFIIARYAVPVVRGYLHSRRAEVLEAIEESAAKKRQAEALVQDYKNRLAAVDTEMAAIQAALREDGEREKDKLLSDAQELTVKIKEDTRFLADQEVRMARQRVREEMAERAEAEARELVRRNMTAEDQGRLVQEFTQHIGQSR